MNNAELDATIARLDAELEGVGQHVGIAVGSDLFRAMREAGKLTLETGGAVGTLLFSCKLPAYHRTHYVFETWDLGPTEFRVGSEA